ncbi:hypothetical protein GJ496_000557 [Pomphorhynchus laevis]|nr:hypothetical protein GJ496_000557 [Pomphorhynchus laevis]
MKRAVRTSFQQQLLTDVDFKKIKCDEAELEFPSSTVYNKDGEVVDRITEDNNIQLLQGDRFEIRMQCIIEQLSAPPSCTLLGYRLNKGTKYPVMYWPSSVVVVECTEGDALIRIKGVSENSYLNHSPSLLRFTPQMEKVAQEMLNSYYNDYKAIRAVVVGNKDVGKSTFLRYILNCLLTRIATVQWLDLDPGQCEFTPPGLVSLVSQTQPLFGFAHNHILHDHKEVGSELIQSFFIGQLSPSACPLTYRSAVQALALSIRRDEPLLINTMGWMHGMGLQFLEESLNLIKPTHIIHLVADEDDPIYESQYHVIRVDCCQSGAASNASSSVQQRRAKESRDMAFKHYFDFKPASAHSIVKAPINQLAVGMCDEKISVESYLPLLKGLVAVCTTSLIVDNNSSSDQSEQQKSQQVFKIPDKPLRWLAYGCVRAITEDYIYLSCPINLSELPAPGNCLIKPNFELPHGYE